MPIRPQVAWIALVTFLCVLSVLPVLEYPDCSCGLGSVDAREFVWSLWKSVLHPLVLSWLEAQAAGPEAPWQCTVNHVSDLPPNSLHWPWPQNLCPLCMHSICPFPSPGLSVGCTKSSWLLVVLTIRHLSGMFIIPNTPLKIVRPSPSSRKKLILTWSTEYLKTMMYMYWELWLLAMGYHETSVGFILISKPSVWANLPAQAQQEGAP